MDKTITEISEAEHISRFTLSQAARKGWLGGAATLRGHTYLIDTEHEDYKKWLAEHWQQPRVKGEKKG